MQLQHRAIYLITGEVSQVVAEGTDERPRQKIYVKSRLGKDKFIENLVTAFGKRDIRAGDVITVIGTPELRKGTNRETGKDWEFQGLQAYQIIPDIPRLIAQKEEVKRAPEPKVEEAGDFPF